MNTRAWKYLPLLEAVADKTALGNKVPQSQFKKSGKVPIVDQGSDFIAGYSNSTALAWTGELPIVVFGDHTRVVKYVDFPFVLGADGVKVLLPNKDLSAKFVYYYLLNVNLPSHGYARHFSHLKRVQIPVPPLSDQERIVELLEQTDELRRLRTESDRYAATLSSSVFNEMFGDPEHTRYPARPLAELVVPGRPITYGILKPGPEMANGIPYVRVVDIKEGHLHVEQLKKTTREIADQYRRSTLIPGDVLITIRGTVGRTCVVPDELRGANITQDTARLAVIPAIQRTYIEEFLNTPWAQSWMSHHTQGQAVKGINLGDLKKLPVPVPPLQMQTKFAAVASEIHALQTQQAASRRSLDSLFQSMMHRAFNGGL